MKFQRYRCIYIFCLYPKLVKCLTPNKCHPIPVYLYLGTHSCNTIIWRSFCWGLCPRSPLGICSARTMSPIPLVHTFSGEDVPYPWPDICPPTTMFLFPLRDVRSQWPLWPVLLYDWHAVSVETERRQLSTTKTTSRFMCRHRYTGQLVFFCA